MRLGLAVVLGLLGVAAQRSASAGPAGFAFLEVPAGARASSLGGAYASVAEGVEAAYWNPAEVAHAHGVQLLAGHHEFFQGLRHEQFAVAGGAWGGGYALSLRAMYSEGIDERDALGNLLGSFGAHDLDFGLSYGRRWFPGVRAGAALHWVRERIDDDAVNAFPLDVGMAWDAARWPGLRFGLAAQALGAAPRYTIDGVRGDPVPLPAAVQGGASYRLRLSPSWSALGAAETRFTRGRNGAFLAGVEVQSAAGGAARLGWRGNDDAVSFGAGAGWRLGAVSVDYAFVSYRLDLGDTHRVSLLAQF